MEGLSIIQYWFSFSFKGVWREAFFLCASLLLPGYIYSQTVYFSSHEDALNFYFFSCCCNFFHFLIEFVIGVEGSYWFLHVYLYPDSFLKGLIHSKTFLMEFLGSLKNSIMLSAYRKKLTSSLPIYIPFISLLLQLRL